MYDKLHIRLSEGAKMYIKVLYLLKIGALDDGFFPLGMSISNNFSPRNRLSRENCTNTRNVEIRRKMHKIKNKKYSKSFMHNFKSLYCAQ